MIPPRKKRLASRLGAFCVSPPLQAGFGGKMKKRGYTIKEKRNDPLVYAFFDDTIITHRNGKKVHTFCTFNFEMKYLMQKPIAAPSL